MLRFLLLFSFLVLTFSPQASAQNPWASSVQKRITKLENYLTSSRVCHSPEKEKSLNQHLSGPLLKALIYASGHGRAPQLKDKINELTQDYWNDRIGREEREALSSYIGGGVVAAMGLIPLSADKTNQALLLRIGSSTPFMIAGGLFVAYGSLADERAKDLVQHEIGFLADTKSDVYGIQNALDTISSAFDLSAEEETIIHDRWQEVLSSENSHTTLAEILIDATDSKGEPILEDWQVQGIQELEKITLENALSEEAFDAKVSERDKLVQRLKMIYGTIDILQEHLTEHRSQEAERAVDQILVELNHRIGVVEVALKH